jgi:hypothetical protein
MKNGNSLDCAKGDVKNIRKVCLCQGQKEHDYLYIRINKYTALVLMKTTIDALEVFYLVDNFTKKNFFRKE